MYDCRLSLRACRDISWCTWWAEQEAVLPGGRWICLPLGSTAGCCTGDAVSKSMMGSLRLLSVNGCCTRGGSRCCCLLLTCGVLQRCRWRPCMLLLACSKLVACFQAYLGVAATCAMFSSLWRLAQGVMVCQWKPCCRQWDDPCVPAQ
jgi:hypothetical protein